VAEFVTFKVIDIQYSGGKINPTPVLCIDEAWLSSQSICKPSEQRVLKGKAFPLQAWRGPWGSRRLRLQNF
jgi:hypothetical protein